MSRASDALMVAVRITAAPGFNERISPSSPRITAFAWSPFMTMTKTASAFAPTSRALAAGLPPSSTKAAMRGSLRSAPQVSNPAAMRFLARPLPISPRPMTPARFMVSPPICPVLPNAAFRYPPRLRVSTHHY